MLAFITINTDPVAVHLGGLAVHWYGIMYVIAFYVAYRFGVLPHLMPLGLPKHLLERGITWTIVFGLIGGRLYYDVQNDPGYFLTHPQHIFAVWEGGMAFFGAIGAAVLTIVFLLWKWNMTQYIWPALDAGALFAVIGQPIGRIGNIINGDILGGPSNLPWATAYTFPTGYSHCAVLQPGFACGIPYQPAAAYEAIGTILIGIILFRIRARKPRAGLLIVVYLALYAISQFVVFFWRQSEPVIGLGLKQAQWTAIVMLVVIVPIVALIWRRFPGKPILTG